MELEKFIFIVEIVFVLIGINVFFCWFLGMFTTGRYYYKLQGNKDSIYIENSFLPKFMGRPLIYGLYITWGHFFKDYSHYYYQDLSVFRKNARWIDFYVAYGMIFGFIVAVALMILLKLLEYFFL